MIKIHFVCQNNARAFIEPIIEKIQQDYEISIYNHNQILNNTDILNNCDLIWVEWATDFAAFIAEQYPSKRKIIRLHSYEAYTKSIYKIRWEGYSDSIFVADFLKNKVSSLVPNFYKKTKIHVIANGIDTKYFRLKKESSPFDIGFAAYLKHVKNIPLLLQCFHALYKKDQRYRLHIAGKLEGGDLESGELYDYIAHMTKALKLHNAIQFDGWITDMNEWYETKDFIVSTSIRESQGVNLAEGMSKGLMPVVHNFPAACEHYPPNCIFNTPDEFVKIISTNKAHPEVWRTIAIDKFNIDDKVNSIKSILNSSHRNYF